MRRALLLLGTMTITLLLVAGMAIAATPIFCQADVDCFGTKNPDTLEGSTGRDRIFGLGGGDTLKGLNENDSLYGQGGSDELLGGVDGDYLTGGPGGDALSGGEGIDQYFFGPRWGKDTIIDDSTTVNIVVFQKSFSEPVHVTQNLTIKLTPGTGPEIKNKRGTTTINWEGNIINRVQSGAGDDNITGNNLANDIFGEEGNDTVFGRGGNDNINVADGSGGDVVDCGEPLIGSDADEVVYDPGDEISDNCETKVIAT